MKRYLFTILLSCCLFIQTLPAHAQDQEAIQLVLDIEKLAKFKQILQQLYDGYKILETGYNKVKDITSGNYSLHQVFLDGLYLVSPGIKKYQRVADIIEDQGRLVAGYKNAFSLFKSCNVFSQEELSYMGKVYGGLLEKSADNLDALLMVITDSKLRMSDDERLQRIDHIYKDMEDMLSFLRQFNGSTQILAFQRVKETAELNSMQTITSGK